MDEKELNAFVTNLKHENQVLKAMLEDKKRAENSLNVVNVRWFDGYLETFEATEVRFGTAYLWMRLSDGQNRHIPLHQVRWFSLSRESHAQKLEG